MRLQSMTEVGRIPLRCQSTHSPSRSKLRLAVRASILLLSLLWLSMPARADIVEWRDAQGVRHFTNVSEDIPSSVRNETRLVAREHSDPAASPAPPSVAVASSKPAEDDPPRQAQVVYDPTHLASVYRAGLEEGLLLEQRAGARSSGPTQVIAPVAIANAPAAPAYAPYSAYPPYLEVYGSPYFWAGLPGPRFRQPLLRSRVAACPFPYRNCIPPDHNRVHLSQPAGPVNNIARRPF